MRKIRTIKDVVDWGHCVGCGACSYYCDRNSISLLDVESSGIRPRIENDTCVDCTDCLSFCPGYLVNAEISWQYTSKCPDFDHLIGPSQGIWEGFASDEDLRYRASSGGILTALSLYCLERENMEFVLHTGMDPSEPWRNVTVRSKDRYELIERAGSRYAPASPCDSLDLIEESEGKCVFIGKPCDTAAVSMLGSFRPKLEANIGLLMTFFCAGTPSTSGTLGLLENLGIRYDEIRELRYRGNGWPGNFNVLLNGKMKETSATYKASWGYLAKYRPYRCMICPDGLGELADISCGDAWHRYPDDENPGRSLIIARTRKGRELLLRASAAGYIDLTSSGPAEVIAAQGLVQRRRETFGRLAAMRILLIPTPRFIGFSLFRAWMETSLLTKIRTVFGSLRRLLLRGYWRRNNLF